MRKDVIDDVIRFDAERVLNDLGGPFAVVTVDGSFQQVTHLRTRHTRHQAPKRTAKKWASGGRKVPAPVAIILRLMLAGELTVELLERVGARK